MHVQPKNVGRRVEPAQLDEFDQRLLAEPLDVERAAADEMAEPLEPLCGANEAAGAAHIDLALLAYRLALTFGATVGEDVGRALLVASQILHDLRDDVAGALDADAVADTQ